MQVVDLLSIAKMRHEDYLALKTASLCARPLECDPITIEVDDWKQLQNDWNAYQDNRTNHLQFCNLRPIFDWLSTIAPEKSYNIGIQFEESCGNFIVYLFVLKNSAQWIKWDKPQSSPVRTTLYARKTVFKHCL